MKNDIDHVFMPAIACPFPSEINPHVEKVQEALLAWVRGHRLVQGERALRRCADSWFPVFLARVHPTIGPEELALVTEWHTCLWLLDDHLDEGSISREPEGMSLIQAQLDDLLRDPGAVPRGPIQEAIHDLWQRTAHQVSPAWRDRFARNLASWIETNRRDAENRIHGRIPDLESYVESRYRGGNIEASFDLLEIGLHSELPEAVRGSPELRALRRAAGNAICWINDLFSLRKELARGETNNLVVVLQRAHRCSLQEAIDRTHAMTEGEILLFGERERCLPACAPEIEPVVRKYVIDLRNYIPATLKWTLSSPRYSQVEHTGPGEIASYMEAIL